MKSTVDSVEFPLQRSQPAERGWEGAGADIDSDIANKVRPSISSGSDDLRQ